MKKLHFLLATLAAIILMTTPIIGCSTSHEDAGSDTQVGDESEASNSEALDTVTSTDNGAFSKVNVSCNTETVFEKVKISAKCSGDDDKDDYPDSDAATIESLPSAPEI
jgi:hypothetical protein